MVDLFHAWPMRDVRLAERSRCNTITTKQQHQQQQLAMYLTAANRMPTSPCH